MNQAALEQIRQTLLPQMRFDAVVPPFSLVAAFSNNWGATTSVGFTRGSDFIVRLQGVATRASGTPTTLETITTLPAGFRPGQAMRFAVAAGDGTTANAYGRVDIGTDGVVKWVAGPNAATAFVSLDNVSFRAAN